MGHFHRWVVLFCTIVISDLTPLGWGHSLCHQACRMAHLLVPLVYLVLGPFRYAKLQEHVLRLVELRRIFFHIRFSLWCVTPVLSHHGEVAQ